MGSRGSPWPAGGSWPGKYSQTDEWIRRKDGHGKCLFQRGEFEMAVLWYASIIKELREVYRVKHVRDVSPLYGIYSAHAVCCEKVGCYIDAKRSAHSMVKMFPIDPRGYMRRARIEAVIDTPETALHTYREGLERCDRDSKDYPKLVELYRKLKANIKSGPISKKRNLITLPTEIQHLILSHLSYKELIECTRVSRGWQRVILSNRHVQTTVDLTDTTTELKVSNLESLFKKATTPERLIMYTYPNTNTSTTKALLKNILRSDSWREMKFLKRKLARVERSILPLLLSCQHEKINSSEPFRTRCENVNCTALFSFARNLRVVVDEGQTYTETELTRLFMSCPRLEQVHLTGIEPGKCHFPGFYRPQSFSTLPKPPLKSFKATCEVQKAYEARSPWQQWMTPPSAPKCYSNAILNFVLDRGEDTLVELTVGGIADYHGRSGGYLDFSPLKQLRHLEITCADLHEPVKVPESLETFRAHASTFVGPTLVYSPENKFPVLRSLDIASSFSEERYLHEEENQFIEGIEDTEWVERTNFFEQVARTNNGTLRDLHVGYIYNDHELDNIVSTGIFRSVTHLQMNLKFRQLSDSVVDRFISGSPNIEALDVSHSEIDDYRIRYLVVGLTKLKYIDISFCPASGRWIQEFLRRVHVEFRAREHEDIAFLFSARHGD